MNTPNKLIPIILATLFFNTPAIALEEAQRYPLLSENGDKTSEWQRLQTMQDKNQKKNPETIWKHRKKNTFHTGWYADGVKKSPAHWKAGINQRKGSQAYYSRGLPRISLPIGVNLPLIRR